MELIVALLGLLCLFLAFLCYRLTAQKKELQASVKNTLTVDANQLLAELLKGKAVIVADVVDPSAVFLWGKSR